MKTPNMRKSEVELLRQIVSRRPEGPTMEPRQVPDALLAILASIEDPPPGKPPMSAAVREAHLRRVNIMETIALDVVAICGEIKRRLRAGRNEG